MLVNVHGENRGRRIQHGRQRRNNGGSKRCKREALQPGGQKLQQPRVRLVGLSNGRHVQLARVAQAGHDGRVLDHDISRDAGYDHDEGKDEFEASSEEDAVLRFV